MLGRSPFLRVPVLVTGILFFFVWLLAESPPSGLVSSALSVGFELDQERG